MNAKRIIPVLMLLCLPPLRAGEVPLEVETKSVSKLGTVRAVLSNGLTVLLKENHSSPAVHVRVVAQVGAVTEEGWYGCGISHQVEHLVSGGTTTTRTEEETRKLLDSIGAQGNAFTSRDQTAYHLTVTSRHVKTATEVLADWFKNSAITQEEFKREMGVVTRETERSKANPTSALWTELSKLVFRVHPARFPVLGYNAARQKLTLDDINDFRNSFYVPENMIYAAAGDFDADELLGIVCEAFAGFEPGTVPVVNLPTEPEQVSPRSVEREFPDVKGVRMALAFPTVPLTHPDLYALDVLAGVLGGGKSSRLFRRLVVEEQTAQSCSAFSSTPGYGGGIFGVSCRIGDYSMVDDARQAIKEELERMKRQKASAAELNRVKAQVAADFAYQAESIENQVASIVSGQMAAGDPDFDFRYVDGIRSVSAAEVMAAARKYFDPNKLNVVVLKPEGAGDQTDVAGGDVKQSSVEKVMFDNGATLLLKRNTAAPVFALQAYFLAGLRTETPENNGISSMTSIMMMQGTKSRTKKELDEAIESMGAGLSASSGNYTLYVRATGLSGDFEDILKLFADVIMHPSFPEDDFARERKRRLFEIAQADDDIRSQARRLLARTLYKSGPYAMDRIGTEESIKDLDVSDLTEYHKSRIVPNNMVISLFGDIEVDAARKAVERAFKDFEPDPQLKKQPKMSAPKLTQDVTEKAFRKKKEAAVVSMAWPGMAFDAVEDRHAMEVLDAIISRVPGGWLHEDLRGRRLVYVVHGYNLVGLDPRHYEVFAMTRPDAVEEVTKRIEGHIKRIKEGDFTEEQFDAAKTYCISNEILGRRGNMKLGSQAALDELYGLGYDFNSEYARRIKAVTRDDVLRVAKKYFKHKATVIVTHGE